MNLTECVRANVASLPLEVKKHIEMYSRRGLDTRHIYAAITAARGTIGNEFVDGGFGLTAGAVSRLAVPLFLVNTFFKDGPAPQWFRLLPAINLHVSFYQLAVLSP